MGKENNIQFTPTGWEREDNGRYKKTQVDLVSGVLTTWQRNLQFGIISRKDQLPNGLVRIAKEHVEPEYSFQEIKEYSLTKIDDKGVKTKINLDVYPPKPWLRKSYESGGLGREWTVKDEKKAGGYTQVRLTIASAKDYFDANFDNKGHVIGFMMGEDFYSTMGDQYYKYMSVPVMDRIGFVRGVVSLFKAKGELIFYPSLDLLADTETVQSEKERVESYLLDRLNDKFKSWSEKDKIEAAVQVWVFLDEFFEIQLPSVEKLTEDERTELVEHLIRGVLVELPDDFGLEDQSKILEQLTEAAGNAFAQLLIDNATELDSRDKYRAHFKITDEMAGIMSITFKDSNEKEILTDEFVIGQEYRFAETIYKVEIDQDGKITLALRSIHRPNVIKKIEFPKSIDLSQLQKVILAEDPADWEKGFALVPIEAQIK